MITVVGCDGGPPPPGAAAALRTATLVVGAARHLSTVDVQTETLVLGDVAAAVRRIAAHEAAGTGSAGDGSVVVLASGDPGFFGITRALRRAGLRPVVLPAISSVAHAFARLGLPWDDALVVSAHGRDLRRAVNACRAYRKVAVLTGPGAGPAELAQALRGVPRRLVVAARLGTPDEQVTESFGSGKPWSSGYDKSWPEPNVVLCLGEGVSTEASPRAGHPPPPADWPAGHPPPPAGWLAGRPPPPAGWALPEAAFAYRDSMITKAEVRALVLARLGPRIGDLIWDVGTGSGSVAVECARLGAAAIAVDRDPQAAALATRNAADHDVDVQVVTGAAPGVLDGLPDPDAVFVGGGGPDVLAACTARRPARVVTAIAAVDRVGPALAVLRDNGFTAAGTQLHAQRLVPLPDGAHRLTATNPVFVLWGAAE